MHASWGFLAEGLAIVQLPSEVSWYIEQPSYGTAPLEDGGRKQGYLP